MLRDTNQVDWKRIECSTYHQNIFFRFFAQNHELELGFTVPKLGFTVQELGFAVLKLRFTVSEPNKSKNKVLVIGTTLNSLPIDLVGVPKHARTQLERYRRVWPLAGTSCRPTTVSEFRTQAGARYSLFGAGGNFTFR